MPKWIDAFERMPENQGSYFIKKSGRKALCNLQDLIELVEDKRYDEILWLDEADERHREFVQLMTVESVDDFIKLKYPHFSISKLKKLINWHERNDLHDTFRKFYMRRIMELETKIRNLSNGEMVKEIELPVIQEKPKIKSDKFLERIKLLNENPFFDS